MKKQEEACEFTYGFRYDPMEWLQTSRSVAAAQVRTLLLRKPMHGDKEILEEEIDRLLAGQNEDGSLGEEGTTGKLIRLSSLGCSPERDEVKNAIAYVCKKEEGQILGCYDLRIAAWANWPDTALIRRSATKLTEQVQTMNFNSLCPWGGQVHTHGMWAAREFTEIGPALDRAMEVMLDNIHDSQGWPTYLDAFGFLDAVGNIDHPGARKVLIKLLPLILRTQQTDGSWGGMKHLGYGPENVTYIVLRALIRWDLFDQLRQLPPFPKDWKITRSIAAPKGDLSMLTWANNVLWVYEREGNAAIGISSDDGEEMYRVRLPEGEIRLGLLTDRQLAVCIKKVVDGERTETSFLLRPDQKKPLEPIQDAKWMGLNDVPNWWFISDFFGGGPPVLRVRPLQMNLNPDVDSGEAPFQQHTTGVAHDGKNIWVLDNKEKRLCVIVKNR